MKKALILVDIQYDFLPGGALAVDEGDAILPGVLRLMDQFELVVATQDWHPRDHGSFAANHPGHAPYDKIDLNGLEQVLWPVHCVQETSGAQFHDSMPAERITKVFPKGTDPQIDSYSGFFDNGRRKSTGMGEWLKKEGVEEVHVVGLAADFCVKYTALDAVELGFATVLHEDLTRGVNIEPDDTQKAIQEMARHGVQIV